MMASLMQTGTSRWVHPGHATEIWMRICLRRIVIRMVVALLALLQTIPRLLRLLRSVLVLQEHQMRWTLIWIHILSSIRTRQMMGLKMGLSLSTKRQR